MSLKLNALPQFRTQPKEYILKQPPPEKIKLKRPGSAFVFSEKDLPGYQPKKFSWDVIDEDGNPGQGRSHLYERHKREVKRKEQKNSGGKFTPYAGRPIPKQTIIDGVISREYDFVPVRNEEFFKLEGKNTLDMLKLPDKNQVPILRGKEDPSRRHQIVATNDQRRKDAKVWIGSFALVFALLNAVLTNFILTGRQRTTSCSSRLEISSYGQTSTYRQTLGSFPAASNLGFTRYQSQSTTTRSVLAIDIG